MLELQCLKRRRNEALIKRNDGFVIFTEKIICALTSVKYAEIKNPSDFKLP